MKQLELNDLAFAGLPEEVQKAVEVVDSVPMISSLSVAKLFNRQHKNLLRAIGELLTNINGLILEPVKSTFLIKEKNYIDGKKEERLSYYLNEYTFHLLVGSMTGKKVFETKALISYQFKLTRETLVEALKTISDLQAETIRLSQDRAIDHALQHTLISKDILDNSKYPNINREFKPFMKRLYPNGLPLGSLTDTMTQEGYLTLMFRYEHKLEARLSEELGGNKRQVYNSEDIDRVEKVLSDPDNNIKIVDVTGSSKFNYYYDKVVKGGKTVKEIKEISERNKDYIASRDVAGNPDYPNINKEFVAFLGRFYPMGYSNRRLRDFGNLTHMFEIEHNLRHEAVKDGNTKESLLSRYMFSIEDINKVEQLLSEPELNIKVKDIGYKPFHYYFDKKLDDHNVKLLDVMARRIELRQAQDKKKKEQEERKNAKPLTPSELRAKYGFVD